MDFDYQKIKIGFIKYLKELNKNGDTEKYNIKSATSIFSYIDEFEDYLSSIQKSISDISIDISEITNMSFENGMFQIQDNEENQFLLELINDMMEEEAVKTAIDKNLDGVLDKDEMETFFDKIANNDDTKNNISFKDISKFNEDISLNNKTTPKNTNNPNSSNNSSNYTPPTTTTQPAGLEEMSLEQLQAEKTARQTNLDNATKALNSALNGTGAVTPEAKKIMDTAKENMNGAKETYESLLKTDNAIPDELKENQKTNQAEIEANDTEISNAKIAISNSETEIFKQKDAITQLDSNLSQMNTSLNSLEEKKSSISTDDENYSSKIEKINSKISDLKTEITTKENEKKKAQEALEAQEIALAEQKAKLSVLEAKKTELQQTRTEIENEIQTSASQETKTALVNYQNLRNTYEATKAQAINEAQKAVETAKTQLSEVSNRLNEAQNQEIKNKNSVFLGELFSNDTSLEFIYNLKEHPELDIDGDGKADYALMLPDNYDPSKEYPMMVYLHGGKGNVNPQAKGVPKGLLESDLSTFNGIVLCPMADNTMANWSVEDDKMAKKIIDEIDCVLNKYNIDKEQITLSGHSAGGAGAVYLQHYLQNIGRDIFKKMAVISPGKWNGYTNLSDISLNDFNIPIQFYVGDKDGCANNIYVFKEGTPIKVTIPNSDHDTVAINSMQYDADGDGCPDIIQWLYSN